MIWRVTLALSVERSPLVDQSRSQVLFFWAVLWGALPTDCEAMKGSVSGHTHCLMPVRRVTHHFLLEKNVLSNHSPTTCFLLVHGGFGIVLVQVHGREEHLLPLHMVAGPAWEGYGGIGGSQ